MLGFHLDLKFSMLDMEYLESVVTRLRALGYDTILLEMENKFRYRTVEQAVHPEAWGVEQLKHFQNVCKQNGMDIIPKIPLLGHMLWVLQWPQYHHLGESDRSLELCTTHPDTPAFAMALLEEVLELFPDAKMVHLGGDEARNLASCSRCKRSGRSKEELYFAHYQPLITRVEQSGKTVLLYADMLLSYPDLLDRIPTSVTLCDWDYWSGGMGGVRIWGGDTFNNINDYDGLLQLPPRQRWMRNYLSRNNGTLNDTFPYTRVLTERGFDVCLCTSSRFGGDNYWAPHTREHIGNCHLGAQHVNREGLKGMIVTSWAYRGNHLETNWPAIAAAGWTIGNPKLTVEKVHERIGRDLFDADAAIIDVLDAFGGFYPNLWVPVRHLRGDVIPPYILEQVARELYSNPGVRHHWECMAETLSTSVSKLQEAIPDTGTNPMHNHWRLVAEAVPLFVGILPSLADMVHGDGLAESKISNFLEQMNDLQHRWEPIFAATMPARSLQMEQRLRFDHYRRLLPI